MSTRIYSTEHTVNGRAVVKAFTEKSAAIDYARGIVDSPDAGRVSIWEYRSELQPRAALAHCFEKSEWWDTRTWIGAIGKSKRFVRGPK